jgi:hypothetical protein
MHLDDERLNDALRRLPNWRPPPDFTETVLARMHAEHLTRSAPPRAHSRLGLARAALQGAIAGLVTYAAAQVVWPSVLPFAGGPVVDLYVRLVAFAVASLITHILPVAWICAALSLALAASFALRRT